MKPCSVRVQYVFYVTHWSACMFYFIAVQYGLTHDTWIGRHFDDVVDLPLPVRCAAGFPALSIAITAPLTCAHPIPAEECVLGKLCCSSHEMLQPAACVAAAQQRPPAVQVKSTSFQMALATNWKTCLAMAMSHICMPQVCVLALLGNHHAGDRRLRRFLGSQHRRGGLGDNIHVLQPSARGLCARNHHSAGGEA